MLSYIWSYFKTADETTNLSEITNNIKSPINPVINKPLKMSKRARTKINHKKSLNYLQPVKEEV